MADQSNFPTSLDSVPTDRITGDSVPVADWNLYFDAIYNLEVKVGATGGASGSIDYTINNASGLLQNHDARHETGGADIMSIEALSGESATAQKVAVMTSGGAIASTTSELDFVPTGTLTISAQAMSASTRILIGGGGGPPDIVTITASGATNWNKPAGATLCTVRLWAGGGAGARSIAGAGGGGGGGGGYVEATFLISTLSDPVVVTIGAGGVGVDANQDAVGGANTTFGAYLTAYGGGGGAYVDANDGGGGGGGGGAAGAGENATIISGGIGGAPLGGVTGLASTFGGGGGGVTNSAGGQSIWGGGGGGGGSPGAQQNPGGNSMFGGGGGGGGADTVNPGGAGGVSLLGGGTGGIGCNSTGTATDGTQPGGGGGGSEGNLPGSGAAGKAIIISW